MGWLAANVDGQQQLFHNGSIDTFRSDLTLRPQAGIGIVILSNASSGASFATAIRNYVLERSRGKQPSS